jgi:hypothetical protein
MTDASKKQVVKEENRKGVATISSLLKAGPSLSKRDAEDYQIPYFNILSKGAPQLEEDDGKYIQGAKLGQIFNTVTNKVYDSLLVLPVYYRRRFVEWAERGEGSGAPINIYTPEQFQKFQMDGKVVRGDDNKERFVGKPDTYIENTAEHYVIVLEGNGAWSKAIIKMKSTQLKKSRTWNSLMSNQRRVEGDEIYQPKDFARAYTLSTVKEKNAKGSWHGWVITENKWIDELGLVNVQAIIEDATQFEKSIHTGDIEITPTRDDDKSSPKGESSQSGDDIPF